MKRSTAVLFSLFVLTLFLLQGCGKKEEEKNPFETPQTHAQITDSHTEASKQPSSPPSVPDAKPYRLTDQHDANLTVSIDGNDRLYLDNEIHPVVILTFFSPWSYPSRNQLVYLADLQKAYSRSVTVIGILLNPHDHREELETFVKETGADFFISKSSENNDFTRHVLSRIHLPDFMPVPLTVIYHNGLCYRHYEGAVPIEMIEHDIKTITE